jgi:putative ABC transport system ATP-binding protein
MALIEVGGLTKAYRLGSLVTPVLEKVSFSVSEGEFLSIIGPSGSGKTTLLNLLGGLDRDYEGKLKIDGREMRELSDRQISTLRNKTIGFIFQSFHLLDHLTCLENVRLPHFFAGRAGAEAEARALSLLDRVGVPDKAGVRPIYISGGQKQRVAIARALLMQPKLLLCDEPTGNLDRVTGAQIVELFRELNRDLGVTVLVVTHDERLSRVAPRRLLLGDRKIEDTQTAEGEAVRDAAARSSAPPAPREKAEQGPVRRSDR